MMRNSGVSARLYVMSKNQLQIVAVTKKNLQLGDLCFPDKKALRTLYYEINSKVHATLFHSTGVARKLKSASSTGHDHNNESIYSFRYFDGALDMPSRW